MKIVLSLFCVTLAAAMADLLIPAEKGCGTKRYLHLLTSLAVLLLILSPVISLIQGGGDGFSFLDATGETQENYEEVFLSALNCGGKTAFRQGVTAAISRRFDVKEDNIAVAVTYEAEEPVFVRVTLSGKGLLCDPDEIENYLSELLGIDVEVR